MKTRHTLSAIALLCLTACFSAAAASVEGAGLSRADILFLKRAVKLGLGEVAISQGALSQLTDTEAKSLAEAMISEHASPNAELLALAAKKQVALDPQDKESHDLSDQWSLKTKDVDLDYLEKMVSDHTESIRLFERAARSKDREIATFATKTLPTLEHHLEMIQAITRTFRKD
jgi:putative membrane protein